MSSADRRWNKPIFFAWMAIIAAACVMYSAGITHESIWYDEAYSAAMADHPLGQIITLTTFDNHPPLYYLLLGVVTAVLGNSEWAMRSLSVVGAVALVSLGAGPVRRLFGNRTGFIYAAVILFTPAILTYAHEARMYTLAIFAVTAGVLYGYLALRTNRRADWVFFGLASLAAPYLHYYGLIASFFMHLFVFLWLLIKDRKRIKTELVTGGLVLAGYLPWLVVFIRQTLMVHKGFWIGPLSIGSVVNAFLQPFAYKEFFPDGPPSMVPALIICLVLIAGGLAIAAKRRAEKELGLSTILLFVYLGVVVVTLIVSLTMMPIFYSRYLLVCVGLFLLLVSLGISMLPRNTLQVAAVAIFALANIFTIKAIYTEKFNHPMKDLARYLKPEIQPGDLIITSDSYSMGPATYYFPEAEHYYTNNTIEAQWGSVLKVMTPPLHNDEGLKELLATRKSFWYITCNTMINKNIWAILKDEPGWEKSQTPLFYGVSHSYVAFTAQKYIYTGRVDTQPRGVITVHVTGLKPAGHVFALLYDRGPISPSSAPVWMEILAVPGKELTYSFVNLAYKDYAVAVMHDENMDHTWATDPKTQMPLEGFTFVNGDKVNFSSMEGITFDNLKFSLGEPEKIVEAKMMYPPFQ